MEAREIKKIVAALRCTGLSEKCDSCDYGYHLCQDSDCNDACDNERLDKDAADAIEALQAELPKRGEIVRCKDCKWWEAVRGNTIGLCSHEDWTSHNLCNAVDKDGFCYRGESKDDWFCADGERSET